MKSIRNFIVKWACLPVILIVAYMLRRVSHTALAMIQAQNDIVLGNEFAVIIPNLTSGELEEINNWLSEFEVACPEDTMTAITMAHSLLTVLENESATIRSAEMICRKYWPSLADGFVIRPDVAFAIEDQYNYLYFKMRWL